MFTGSKANLWRSWIAVVREGTAGGKPLFGSALLAWQVVQRTGVPGGFRTFEAVHKFALLDEPLSFENGLLTQTLKMKRNVIADRYEDTIDRLY